MQPTIEQMRAALASHDHYVEGPRNNETIFGAWCGMNFVAWCAAFQSYCWIHDCGGTLPMGPKGSEAVAGFRQAFQHAGKWGHEPRVGAWVCYGADAHIEWVDAVTPTGIWTWGGNTGQGSYKNGGGVYRQFRSFASPPEPIEGYCYPDYADAPQEDDQVPYVIKCNDPKHSLAQYLVAGPHVILIRNEAELGVINMDHLNTVPLPSFVFDDFAKHVGE